MTVTTDASGSRGSDVGYVLTHHPEAALTFIALEIDEVERHGVRIHPVAINPPSADLSTSRARSAAARTLYLKREPVRAYARTIARLVARHPLRVVALIWLALSSARLDLPLAGRRLVHLLYGCRVWDVLGERGVRHFHAHFGQTPATIAWFAAAIGEIDSGERCTWSFTIHGFQDFADERLSRLDLKVASASFVACVSDFSRAQLCRVTDPVYWGRYRVVRCGIDLETFHLRERAPHGQPYRIVTVARLSPEKGHLVLLEAIGCLRERGVDVELHVIGDGPSASLIERAVADAELGDRVHLLGVRDPEEVAAELGAAHAFCLPSFAEGIPVSIMEAMARGVPVITTYVGGVPELAIDGVTALVVPAGDSTALAAAIERSVTDRALIDEMVPAARRAVSERHDIATNVGKLVDLFHSIR